MHNVFHKEIYLATYMHIVFYFVDRCDFGCLYTVKVVDHPSMNISAMSLLSLQWHYIHPKSLPISFAGYDA